VKRVGIGAFLVLWLAGLAAVALGAFDTEEPRRVAQTSAGHATEPASTPEGRQQTPVDEPDAYKPLPTPRPKLSETPAGVPASELEQETDPTETEQSTDTARPQSDEEIRAELAQLRSYYASLPDQLSPDAESAPFELTAGQLADLDGWQTSVASVYFDYGGPLACGGRLRRDQFGVANKNLPCGTMVTFRYNGRALRVPVIDRGPYIKGREWDLTGATAIALRFNGLGPIDWVIG
jgi:rare lipoprotein A (peptidoglycan hydrolase)